MPIGNNLRASRLALVLTQSDLAAMIGVTRSAIGNYESEVAFPRSHTLMRLIEVLNIDANALLGTDDEVAVNNSEMLMAHPAGHSLNNHSGNHDSSAMTKCRPRIRHSRSSRLCSDRQLLNDLHSLPPSARLHVLRTISILQTSSGREALIAGSSM